MDRSGRPYFKFKGGISLNSKMRYLYKYLKIEKVIKCVYIYTPLYLSSSNYNNFPSGLGEGLSGFH